MNYVTAGLFQVLGIFIIICFVVAIIENIFGKKTDLSSLTVSTFEAIEAIEARRHIEARRQNPLVAEQSAVECLQRTDLGPMGRSDAIRLEIIETRRIAKERGADQAAA